MIQFKLNHKNARLPRRATQGSAGFDLYAVHSATIPPGCRTSIDTGVSFAPPDGWAGFIWPRSGLAARYGLDVMAGLIDADYRASIKVCVINHGPETVEISDGDRIAQLVVQPYMTESTLTDSLGDTERGSGGFGSTGL